MNRFLGFRDAIGIGYLDGDRIGILEAEQPHETRGQRHKGDIVLIASERGGPLCLHHANDFEGNVADENILPDGIFAVGKERIHNGLAEHDDRRIAVEVRFGEKAALCHLPVAHGSHFRPGAVDLRPIIHIAEAERTCRAAFGDDGSHIAQLADRFGISRRQCGDVAA